VLLGQTGGYRVRRIDSMTLRAGGPILPGPPDLTWSTNPPAATANARSLWVATETFSSPPSYGIARIDAATRAVAAHFPLRETPWALAAGPGGLLTIDQQRQMLDVLDPTTGRIIATRDLSRDGASPAYSEPSRDLVVDGGTAWVVRYSADGGVLLELNARTGALRRRHPVRSVMNLAAADGAAWVLDASGPALERIPATR
jgi:hypothetical protein